MTTLSVPDMSCNHCKATVEAALGAVPDAGAVTVDLTSRKVQVAGPAPTATLLQALDKARGGDELHLGHLSLKSVPAVLVEENLGVQLFSELSLVPLLLDDTEEQRQTETTMVSTKLGQVNKADKH